MTPDPRPKRAWRIDGRLLLAVVAGALVVLAALVATRGSGGGSAVTSTVASGAAGEPLDAIRYDSPDSVRGSRTELVRIRRGDDGSRSSRASYYDEPGGRDGTAVNVVFVDPGKPEGRLLLGRPAFIGEIQFPHVASSRHEPTADSLQTWISYEIALADTDGDARLDSGDAASLYVSALDGTGFRRATPAGLDVVSHSMRPDRRSILVMALELPADGRRVPRGELRERVFLYDVPTHTLTPWAAVEGPGARAARIVGK